MLSMIKNLLLAYFLTISNEATGNEGETTCLFNSMCTCSRDQEDPDPSVDSISCYSVPFYRFPTVPMHRIDRIEIVDSMISNLEFDPLGLTEMQALVFRNNKLLSMSNRIFSSSLNTLVSLDFSYNHLTEVPFQSLEEVKNLHWLNLHGNSISTLNGDWSHMKTSLRTLFVGQNDLHDVTSESSKAHTGIRLLKSLSWINADANRIHKIHKHSLPSSLNTISFSYNLIENFPLDIIIGTPHLEWLYLRGNHIKYIPMHTFDRKFWIQKIDLNENDLKALPIRPFNSSIVIKDVFLANNEFERIEGQNFYGLNCKRIDLSYNLINHIEESAFVGIQGSLEFLDLSYNKLVHMPSAIEHLTSLKYFHISSNSISNISLVYTFMNVLKVLSLDRNQLGQVPSILNSCTKISYLNLAFNRITDIRQQDFGEWSNTLITLDLSNNRIRKLDALVFGNMTNLKEINLNFNSLEFVDDDAFMFIEELESLSMSFCLEGDFFPQQSFKSMSNLTHLFLDNNNFRDIQFNSFYPMKKLQHLDVEANDLSEIPDMLFNSNVHSNLKTIMLGNNDISSIKTGTFQTLKSLDYVWATDNDIQELHSRSFEDLPSLRGIFLQRNHISTINFQTFANLPSLEELDLQYNNLQQISWDVFENTSSPLVLNVSHNQIQHCPVRGNFVRTNIVDFRYNYLTSIPQCLISMPDLKKLYLSFNQILSLNNGDLDGLAQLELLSLSSNSIQTIHQNSLNLPKLQVLDLSRNSIENLGSDLFLLSPMLRILSLSQNQLTYLYPKIFHNTQLEFIDLSYNMISIIPKESLAGVGLTLRYLSLECNNLEHIDISSFPNITNLVHLDLHKNKLSILPDNILMQLGKLQHLDLESNPVRANFKELFHYAQNLKHLSLANTGLMSAPHIPLPDLIHLNLSYNRLTDIDKNTIQHLTKLKYLDLSNCGFSYIPSNLWSNLTSLKVLDLSRNPIKAITVDSFYGLKSLQVLNLQHLELVKFESKSLTPLRILAELHFQTYPGVSQFNEEFCYLLSKMTQLRRIFLHISEYLLDKQLHCLTNKKITQLVITGKSLHIIDKNAFIALTRNPKLTIKIGSTRIARLPEGLFGPLARVPHLRVDLSNNMLSTLSPGVLYSNDTSWEEMGTKILSGGLILSNNPLRCGCHLSWLRRWLKRWSRENFNNHKLLTTDIKEHQEVLRHTTCISESSLRVPIVDSRSEDNCEVESMLTGGVPSHSGFLFVYLSLLMF